MDMGVWHAGLTKLCRFLDMVPMSQAIYTKHILAVTYANNCVVTRVLDAAAATVRRVYREIDSSLQEDAVIDQVVSLDGSWMTRGHKSAYGIGCVIDTMTGLCVDLAVLSSCCQRCSYAWRRYGKHSPEFGRAPWIPECNDCVGWGC
ncbi:hypothetical protein NP493_76g02000 [Ridgeia piscesae]|uniref:Mutator-like transposase domain-containing protein n=1 Tax=Ridgeia piscesae TaxID=27915 RepID=A0AAD9P9S1_RIDPI|nr:hypothetical protein NP493_76g02000 [Ridgeia piscesae]